MESEILDNILSTFAGDVDTDILRNCVLEKIPMNSDQYKITRVEGMPEKFKASIICKLNTVELVNAFLKEYGKKNNETLRILSKKESKCYKFIHYYRCHHNTRNIKTKGAFEKNPFKRVKNTNCPFRLIVKAERDPNGEFDAFIELMWNHNHATKSMHVLSFKDISDCSKEKIRLLFERGLLPGSAYKELLRQLKSECSSDVEYHLRLSDRSIVPRRHDFNAIYGQFTKEKFGTGNIQEMYKQLGK